MKPTLLYLLLALAFAQLNVGCRSTVTVTPLAGGGTVTTTEKGLTPLAAELAVDGMRHYLRMPLEPRAEK